MLITFIILFLLLSGLFSGSEIAYVSANKLRIELKKKKGGRRSAILAKFYEKPADFLGTMLVGNNIALVVFTTLMTKLLDPYLAQLIPLENNEAILLLINTLIITIVVLIFGEFLPKTLFRLYPDEILYFLAHPLQIIKYILAAPSWAMNTVSTIFLRVFFKASSEDPETAFTRLDLQNFVNDPRTDSDEEIDKTMFGKALNLKDIRVHEAMVPRPEIEYIDVEASIDELEQLFKETKHSRIIVIQEEVDNVLGYVHHQQLLNKPTKIQGLVLDLPFVPEVMSVTKLMNRFIKEQVNIACVVDEYGGIAGIITLEDIVEEIFGEIEDEHDQEEYVEIQISEKEFIFSGRLEIDYLNEKYENIDFPDGDYHTLSGYLVMTTEKIPDPGTRLELDGYLFILELVSDTKIETIRVIKLDT
jgi:CBS domain containing-hemolysin-like protein